MISQFKIAQEKLFYFLEIDRAVFFAIMAKLSLILSNLIILFLIPFFFSPEVQGFYYTFLSITSIQVFAEMGLGVVISTYTSHEWAHLSFNNKLEIKGDLKAKLRLISLGNFAFKWYLSAAILLSIGLMLGGGIFFASSKWDSSSEWFAPWIMLSIISGINLLFIPVWSFLEGCNRTVDIYFYKFAQSIVVGIVTCLAIYFDSGLWTAFIAGLTLTIFNLLTICRKYKIFLLDILFQHAKKGYLDWRKDILPMQWRISGSWLSGYLTFSLFTPVLFHYQGPIVAGQAGLTLLFAATLTTLASSWIQPKAPVFAILIARKKYEVLRRKFWKLVSTVTVVTFIMVILICFFIYLLNRWSHPLSLRLLPTETSAYFLFSSALTAISIPFSTYLRAFKREPLLQLSIFSGLLSAISIFVTGKYYSAEIMAINNFIITLLIIPCVFFIWHKCSKQWQT